MKREFPCDRRTFMKLAAVLGGAAALTGLRKPAGAAPGRPEAQSGPAPAAGYRLTEHVKRYYETARP
jgi:hypothetical protein